MTETCHDFLRAEPHWQGVLEREAAWAAAATTAPLGSAAAEWAAARAGRTTTTAFASETETEIDAVFAPLDARGAPPPRAARPALSAPSSSSSSPKKEHGSFACVTLAVVVALAGVFVPTVMGTSIALR